MTGTPGAPSTSRVWYWTTIRWLGVRATVIARGVNDVVWDYDWAAPWHWGELQLTNGDGTLEALYNSLASAKPVWISRNLMFKTACCNISLHEGEIRVRCKQGHTYESLQKGGEANTNPGRGERLSDSASGSKSRVQLYSASPAASHLAGGRGTQSKAPPLDGASDQQWGGIRDTEPGQIQSNKTVEEVQGRGEDATQLGERPAVENGHTDRNEANGRPQYEYGVTDVPNTHDVIAESRQRLEKAKAVAEAWQEQNTKAHATLAHIKLIHGVENGQRDLLPAVENDDSLLQVTDAARVAENAEAPEGCSSDASKTGGDAVYNGHPTGTSNGTQAWDYEKGKTKEGQRFLWTSRLVRLAHEILRADKEYHKGHLTLADIRGPLRAEMFGMLHSNTSAWAVYQPPPSIDEDTQWECLRDAVEAAWETFKEKERNDLIVAQPVVPRKITIPWESFSSAVEANAEYLKRIPVLDKLLYSSAVSMITGGKHAGKSTLARWMAVCIAKGWPCLKREVVQGPVCYIASDDETMPARQELIRLGWEQNDPLRFLAIGTVSFESRLELLEALAADIAAMRANLVVLDMLFDFVDISDEMSYAGTRNALGRIQDVASKTGAHIVTIHHAPKHAQGGDAAIMALGSQGLAARVSPIILVRRFGPGVHSVVSTSVRDPRGEALAESRLTLNPDGSVVLGGPWKTYMLAEAYAPKVLEFMQDEEAEVTAPDVVERLGLAYEVARACLNSLWKGGIIERLGEGMKRKPYRYKISISNPNPKNNTPQGAPMGGILNRDSGIFGYKE